MQIFRLFRLHFQSKIHPNWLTSFRKLSPLSLKLTTSRISAGMTRHDGPKLSPKNSEGHNCQTKTKTLCWVSSYTKHTHIETCKLPICLFVYRTVFVHSLSLFHLCVVVVVVLLRGNVNRIAWSFLCTQKKCNIKVNSYEFVWWRWNEVTHCTRNWGKDHTDESTTDGRCRITANKQLLCDIVMKNSTTER